MKNLLILCCLLLLGCQQSDTVKTIHKGMWSNAPAQKWQDALIGGNGEMGVLVFGDPAHEKVIFNHEFCYEFIGSEDVEPPLIGKYLPEVRKLMYEGKYDEATQYSYEMAVKEGYGGLLWTDPYHPAMLMHIDQEFQGNPTDYRRSVNFETGEITVTWSAGDDHWKRKTVVSRPGRVVAQRFTGTDKINLSFKMGQLVPEEIAQQDKYGETLQLKPSEITVNDSWIVFRQPYKLSNRGYEVVTKVQQSAGEVRVAGDQIHISNADHVLVLTRIEFLEDYGQSMVSQTKTDVDALGFNYHALLEKHAAVHGEMFDRVVLDLNPGEEALGVPSEAFIANQDQDADSLSTAFLQTMFDMGRYALISSSGKNPPNFIFAPSYSPENSPANIQLSGSINATMDIAAAKEALQHLITVCEQMNIENENIPKWKAMLQKLPPYLVNEEGALKEWATPDLEDNYDHRHISHMYPVWPGLEINPEETPEMFRAASVALDKKGRGNNSAHGLMHTALIAARLKKAEKVYENLLFMLRNNYVYSSLFTSHNPDLHIYNADALNSLPAVILEMLVYSRPGVIELLPPCSEKLTRGKITGVQCRTQATVEELVWDFDKGSVTATLSSLIDQEVELIFRREAKSFTDEDGNPYPKALDLSRKVALKNNEPVKVAIQF